MYRVAKTMLAIGMCWFVSTALVEAACCQCPACSACCSAPGCACICTCCGGSGEDHCQCSNNGGGGGPRDEEWGIIKGQGAAETKIELLLGQDGSTVGIAANKAHIDSLLPTLSKRLGVPLHSEGIEAFITLEASGLSGYEAIFRIADEAQAKVIFRWNGSFLLIREDVAKKSKRKFSPRALSERTFSIAVESVPLVEWIRRLAKNSKTDILMPTPDTTIVSGEYPPAGEAIPFAKMLTSVVEPLGYRGVVAHENGLVEILR